MGVARTSSGVVRCSATTATDTLPCSTTAAPGLTPWGLATGSTPKDRSLPRTRLSRQPHRPRELGRPACPNRRRSGLTSGTHAFGLCTQAPAVDPPMSKRQTPRDQVIEQRLSPGQQAQGMDQRRPPREDVPKAQGTKVRVGTLSSVCLGTHSSKTYTSRT